MYLNQTFKSFKIKMFFTDYQKEKLLDQQKFDKKFFK